MSIKVGLIGIGHMGKGIGANLLKHKFHLTVYDKIAPNADVLKSQGARVANSVSSLAQQSDFIISMVQNDAQVKQIVLDVIAAANKTPKFLVDCSTVSPLTSKAMLEIATRNGHNFVDAPVSGGVNGAMNGTLTLMVGAESPALFETVKPLLQAMGRPVLCGKVGAGATVKLANNLMLAINMVSAQEGFRLAQKLGVDLKIFNDVVNISSAQSWVTTKYNPVPGVMDGVPAARDYKNGFAVDLMLKDLRLAMDLAHDDAPTAQFCAAIYEEAKLKFGGDLDFGSIFKLTNH